MICLIAFFTIVGLFLFHLAAVFLFCMTFIISLVATGNLGISLLGGIVGAVSGAFIQLYAKKNL